MVDVSGNDRGNDLVGEDIEGQRAGGLIILLTMIQISFVHRFKIFSSTFKYLGDMCLGHDLLAFRTPG